MRNQSVLHRLRNFFLPSGYFRIARPLHGLPDCYIRPVRDTDFDRCEEIYRANELAHFPQGYFPRFSTWLRDQRALILVAETNGVVEAVCGVSAQEQEGHHFAALSFGMVHPSVHKRGYGTALLLARLSLLRTAKHRTIVILTTTGGSERFYKRFGFKFIRSLHPTPAYREDHYFANVTAVDRVRCADFLCQSVSLSSEFANRELPDFSRLDTSSLMATNEA
jgi:predicted N-acetyltransferase YhbS